MELIGQNLCQLHFKPMHQQINFKLHSLDLI